MVKMEGTYIQVAYKNVFGYISTNSWPFFMIQRLTIREECAWVRSNIWRDERPLATGLDRFFSVFRFFDKHCNWQPKKFRICATATGGPVFCSWVQFNFGLFFQSSELDLRTLCVHGKSWCANYSFLWSLVFSYSISRLFSHGNVDRHADALIHIAINL